MPDPKLGLIIHHNNLHKLTALHLQIKAALTAAAHKIGQRLQASAVLHIQTQDMPWTPLTSAYQAWKVKKGYSPLVYIMTGSYMNNIKYEYLDQEMVVVVGVMRAAPPHENGKPLWEIAEVLEYGSRDGRIPARPLWTPLLAEHKRGIQTTIGISIAKTIKQFQAQFPGLPKP